MFDLAADARLFVRAEELGYLVANPPPDWNAEDRRLAAYLVKSGLLAAPPATDATSARAVVTPREAEELLVHLALFLRLVERREASFSKWPKATVSADAASWWHASNGVELPSAIPADLATFRTEAGATRPGDPVLEAGDTLHLYLVGGGLVAVEQEVDARGTSFDRTHNLSSWTRFRSDGDLRASVASRLPGFEFRSFDVLLRGVSGRVGKIRLVGRDAETVEVEGLAVRWTLDVPDTLFTARRLTPEKGVPGWQFSGRGWGHGVGMCQNGSYGMARRARLRSILGHYYGGEMLQMIAYAAPASPRSRAADPSRRALRASRSIRTSRAFRPNRRRCRSGSGALESRAAQEPKWTLPAPKTARHS